MPLDYTHPLYRAVLAEPEEDTVRLVYADHLDETGDPEDAIRAEYIRLQVASARECLSLKRAVRLAEIESQHKGLFNLIPCYWCLGSGKEPSRRENRPSCFRCGGSCGCDLSMHRGFPRGVFCTLEALTRFPGVACNEIFAPSKWALDAVSHHPITRFITGKRRIVKFSETRESSRPWHWFANEGELWMTGYESGCNRIPYSLERFMTGQREESRIRVDIRREITQVTWFYASEKEGLIDFQQALAKLIRSYL